jgi:hypothetical protein
MPQCFIRGLAPAVCGLMLSALATACSKDDTPTAPTSVYGPQPPATFRIDDQPCVAPATGSVSCRFVVTSPGIFVPIPANGPAQYDASNTYTWRFTNPANGRGVEVYGVSWRPTMDCAFLPAVAGVPAQTINVKVTVHKIGNYFTEGAGTVQITRPPGVCGT